MIRHAWHFYYALVLVIKVVCGSIVLCASHLNWALVANEQNVAKARMFKATVHVFSLALYFSFKLLGLL
ncbi:DUF3265 domain-containing protein [Vibrio parahaemolyticus]|nr:DUF3265 domain-containing protein [Vibrio parahaemolyticus]